METFITVCSNLILHGDSVLLVREGKDNIAGVWNLPAGKLEAGETPAEGAVREAREETGLNIRAESLVGIYIDQSDVTDHRVVNFVYHSVIEDKEQEPSAPDDEAIEAVAWVPMEDLAARNLRAPYIREAVTDFRDGKRLPLDTVSSIQ